MTTEVQGDEFQGALEKLRAHQDKKVKAGILRPDNEPRIRVHGRRTEDIVVLVHGLTDSPYFMDAIGRRFHGLGFNVIQPLLPAHGLNEPSREMNSVTWRQWVEEVEENVQLARGLGDRVSIGGLSTGGALSLYQALNDPQGIRGGVFLFSAALQIGDRERWIMEQEKLAKALSFGQQQFALSHEIKENTRAFINDLINIQRTGGTSYGIGGNPYRYSTMFVHGADQLAGLIDELSADRNNGYRRLTQPVFVAHSTADRRAKFEALKTLEESRPELVRLYPIGGEVEHASVVLEEPIVPAGLGKREEANPHFEDMIREMRDFIKVDLR